MRVGACGPFRLLPHPQGAPGGRNDQLQLCPVAEYQNCRPSTEDAGLPFDPVREEGHGERSGRTRRSRRGDVETSDHGDNGVIVEIQAGKWPAIQQDVATTPVGRASRVRRHAACCVTDPLKNDPSQPSKETYADGYQSSRQLRADIESLDIRQPHLWRRWPT